MAGDYRLARAYEGRMDGVVLPPYTDSQQGPSQRNLPDILTAEEAAEYLRISVRTLRRLQARKRVPVIHMGRSVRFSRSALLRRFDPESPDSQSPRRVR